MFINYYLSLLYFNFLLRKRSREGLWISSAAVVSAVVEEFALSILFGLGPWADNR